MGTELEVLSLEKTLELSSIIEDAPKEVQKRFYESCGMRYMGNSGSNTKGSKSNSSGTKSNSKFLRHSPHK